MYFDSVWAKRYLTLRHDFMSVEYLMSIAPVGESGQLFLLKNRPKAMVDEPGMKYLAVCGLVPGQDLDDAFCK